MGDPWWASGWAKFALGWASGVTSSYFGSLLHEKWKERRLKGKEYFTAEQSGGVLRFEGQTRQEWKPADVLEAFFRSGPESAQVATTGSKRPRGKGTTPRR